MNSKKKDLVVEATKSRNFNKKFQYNFTKKNYICKVEVDYAE